MDDEQLEALLRSSAPDAPSRPLTAQQRALMERIMSEPVRRNRRTMRRVGLTLAVPLATVAVLVIVLVLQPFRVQPVAAYGPRPLLLHPTDQTPQQVIGTARTLLSAETFPSESLRQADTTSWSLAVNDAGEPEQAVEIEPTVTTLRWAADLSGSQRVVAGTPFYADGTSGMVRDAPRPGTVIDERTFSPGEYPAAVSDADTYGPVQLRALLHEQAPDRTRPGDAFLAVLGLMGEWTLTPAQHAILLGELLRYDGLTAAGTATDRLGRVVVVLQGETSAPGQTASLLISATTGHIVGIEDVVTDGISPLRVPAGTVAFYILWKDSE